MINRFLNVGNALQGQQLSPLSNKNQKAIMYLILLREKKYLTERYDWSDLPALFPSWQASAVMQMMDKATERPTGWAVVAGGVVDLDKLEVMKF